MNSGCSNERNDLLGTLRLIFKRVLDLSLQRKGASEETVQLLLKAKSIVEDTSDYIVKVHYKVLVTRASRRVLSEKLQLSYRTFNRKLNTLAFSFDQCKILEIAMMDLDAKERNGQNDQLDNPLT